MFELFEKIKNWLSPPIEYAIKDKEWQKKVEGLFPIEIDFFHSDIIGIHMAFSWTEGPQKWCEENCKGRYIFGHFTFTGPKIFFEHEHEAMAFKLRWI